ncbi:MAG: A/G-specific adenine glycosylase [Clostridia bacterium]|nr:A/G-specific adenine glycosylase [Clostridia bacterium]
MYSISPEIIPPILAWHRANRRMLPWRESPTPYHVWISEIMLQQTRIEAVIPYYERFLAAFPDVRSLAEADDERLMKLWEGLGYYSRARNLKKAAGQIMNDCGGILPSSAQELKKLSGIGDYTAGAIASIAYGQPEPAVDGNVLRVTMRLLACADDILAASTKKAVTESLRPLYPTGEDARMLTEGLMALGQKICTPTSPGCDGCPVKAFCQAYKNGNPEAFPCKAEKKARRVECLAVFLLRRDGKYAVRRRREEGLLAGMWEYPNCPVSALPVLPKEVREIGTAKHIFTHIEWHMTGYEAELDDNTALPSDILWAAPEEIFGQYAVPSAFAQWTKYIMKEIENR